MKGAIVNIFWGNLRPVLGKLVSSTCDKKEWFLICHSVCPYQDLRHSIVYINEHCQGAIIFNNLDI